MLSGERADQAIEENVGVGMKREQKRIPTEYQRNPKPQTTSKVQNALESDIKPLCSQADNTIKKMTTQQDVKKEGTDAEDNVKQEAMQDNDRPGRCIQCLNKCFACLNLKLPSFNPTNKELNEE